MIQNDKELEFSKKQVKELNSQIKQLKSQMKKLKMKNQWIKLASDPLISFKLGIEEEIKAYEKNRNS